MNYRHIYHAGNFADVYKHIVLMLLIKSFLRKSSAFCYLDTHAGLGLYPLLSEEAQKTKEYLSGIQKLLETQDQPIEIKEFVNIILNLKNNSKSNLHYYPGSPYIVKNYLRATDRMMLCELHLDDYKTLKTNMRHNKQIAIHHQDGYQALKSLLPPKEKRGLILIDPPYENNNEYTQLFISLQKALSRFETGVYAVWFPIKDRLNVNKFYQSFKSLTNRPILISELTIYPDNLTTHLNGCGMAIINPPYQFDLQLQNLMLWIWETLSINKQGHTQVKFI